VVPRGGETFVYRIENGRAVEAKVELGARRAGEVEVLDGLPATAIVVTAGHQRLRNGAPVEVLVSGTEAARRGG
jgi:membrane fusion protein (multidrug efflux system)